MPAKKKPIPITLMVTADSVCAVMSRMRKNTDATILAKIIVFLANRLDREAHIKRPKITIIQRMDSSRCAVAVPTIPLFFR